MIFETHTPNEKLAPYIESLIHFKHFTPDHSIERLVPTGHIYILFELDGITPKYYQRILRFNEILQHIHQQENICWSNIAHACGYSDQSHFIKEFKHFSGFNPCDFIQQEFNNEEANFFPLDREH